MHPATSPPDIVAALMNAAQDKLQNSLVGVGLDRLWQPSAYLGSYGDLTSPQIRKYIESLRGDCSGERESPPGKPVASSELV